MKKSLALYACLIFGLLLLASCDTNHIEVSEVPINIVQNNESHSENVYLYEGDNSDMHNLVVLSMHAPFMEVTSIIMHAPGLYTQPVTIVDSALMGGVIEYEGQWWSPVDDPRFPHIQSISDIRDKVESVFTKEFVDSRFSHVFHPEYSHFREIDGVLYRGIVDGTNPWVWTTEGITIKDIEENVFTALVYLEQPMSLSPDSLKLTFVLTEYGWRIDNVLESGSGDIDMSTGENLYFVEVDDIDQVFALDAGFIYFGRPTCPNCVVFEPILSALAKETRNRVYYLNTDNWRNHERFSEAIEHFGVSTVPFLN